MEIATLRAALEKYRDGLPEKSGKVLTFSVSGPPNMDLIDKIVAVLEVQDSRIQEIESKTSNL